jgi:hypothetical protein
LCIVGDYALAGKVQVEKKCHGSYRICVKWAAKYNSISYCRDGEVYPQIWLTGEVLLVKLLCQCFLIMLIPGYKIEKKKCILSWQVILFGSLTYSEFQVRRWHTVVNMAKA